MGASFVTFVQRPREVVVVWGDIYHQGGTVGSAIAEAVNYGDPDWSIEGYSECSQHTCPGFPIPNRFLEFRAPDEPQREQDDEASQATHDSVQSQERERLARNRPLTLTRVGKSIEHINKRKTRSQKGQEDVPTPQQARKKTKTHTAQPPDKPITTTTEICDDLVSRMVAAIRSRDNIKQFFDTIHGRRDLETTAFRIDSTTKQSARQLRIQGPAQILENDVKIIRMLSRKTTYHNFLIRLFQVRLANHIDEMKQGRLRNDTAVIENILQRTGMSRRQFSHHQGRGMKWREYCKAFPGILCFIPFQTHPFGFSSESWLNLDKEKFASLCFHLANEYITALCAAGSAFEDSLDPAADDVDFIWENRSLSLTKILDEELIFSLGLFPSQDDNIYDPDAYPDWPRPDEWPDSPWPVDPTSLPHSGGLECKSCHQSNCPCALCHKSNCHCAAVRHETKPRIRRYEGKYDGKNRGLQAVAREAGQIVYRKGVIIDFITGVLTPPDMYHNGQCIQVDRSDILGEPTVAQINCAERGNLIRLVNQSCDPAARFEGMRVSGKFRIALVAERDIYDGEEITAYYGKQYWGKGKCRCPICLARPR
jgi:hypothetical protein